MAIADGVATASETRAFKRTVEIPPAIEQQVDRVFDLASLSKARPEVAPGLRRKPGLVSLPADDDSAWAEGWDRQSVEEMRESLEGFWKR